MTDPKPNPPRTGSSLLARMLGIFAPVETGESASALLLTFNVFLVLVAYYLLKTVREPLILAGGDLTIFGLTIGRPELKAYASVGQAVLLIGMVRVYAALARRLGRMLLSAVILLFFASNLVVFHILARLSVPLGVPFYLWVGCFSVTVIAQFWSFATDIYTPLQGKRLFAIVGIGSSLGAVAGARIAEAIFKPVGPYNIMLLAAGLLLVVLGATYLVHRLESRRPLPEGGEHGKHEEGEKDRSDAPPGGKGALSLLFKDRYLLLLAALTLLLNWVNSTGEYLLDRILVEVARAEVGAQGEQAVKVFIGTFKADYFFWVNLFGLGIQLFLVSRIFKYLGVRIAILFLPAIAIGGYAIAALMPLIAVIRIAKIAENSTDYSIQNTARQALFLPTSRQAKYVGKAAIDTFVVRGGDVLAAVVIAIGSAIGLGTKQFAMINVVLAGLWLFVAVLVGRLHDKRVREQDERDPGGEDGEAASDAASDADADAPHKA